MTTLEILGAAAPLPPQATASVFSPDEHRQLSVWATRSILPGVAAAAAGAFLWKRHRVLGFLGGMALGSSVYPMTLGGGHARNAFLVLGAVGVGVYTSLNYRKHPAWAYLGASWGAAVVTSPFYAKVAA